LDKYTVAATRRSTKNNTEFDTKEVFTAFL
jgi:hypothetical protein